MPSISFPPYPLRRCVADSAGAGGDCGDTHVAVYDAMGHAGAVDTASANREDCDVCVAASCA